MCASIYKKIKHECVGHMKQSSHLRKAAGQHTRGSQSPEAWQGLCSVPRAKDTAAAGSSPDLLPHMWGVTNPADRFSVLTEDTEKEKGGKQMETTLTEP